MKNITAPILPLLFAATLAAQQPTPPATPAQPAAAPANELLPLQALIGDTIHRREATGATATGVAHDTPFARLRDATFDAAGMLVAFVVEAPPTDATTVRDVRILPARDVQWDAPTRRWLLTAATLQWQELEKHDSPAPADARVDKEKQPALATAAPPLRASVLVVGEPVSAAGAAKASDASSRRTPPRVVHWFAPGPRQLAVATWPVAGRHVLVPWHLLRVTGTAKAPQLQLSNSSNVDTAPECSGDETPPTPALRQRCYAHFGIEPPAWDRPRDEAAKPKAKDKDGSEAGR